LLAICSIFERFAFLEGGKCFPKLTFHFPIPRMQISQEIKEWQEKKIFCKNWSAEQVLGRLSLKLLFIFCA